MLNQILNLTRPLICLDTETTGTDVKNDSIVELAFQLFTSEGLQKEYRTLINPGIAMPAGAQEVHGISDLELRSCRTCKSLTSCACPDGFKPWPTFKQLATNLAKGFTDVDFCGKNCRFDLRILSFEFARSGIEWSYAGARVVDIDRLEAWLNKRSLSHLYRKYTGKKLEGAHGALTDVQASTEVLYQQFGQLTQNEDDAVPLPRDLDALHELQWPGWIDSEGMFKFIKGVPCFGRWGKYANRPLTTADNGYWDFILKNDFSAEVKRIAAKAKLKQYPEEANR
jgi:DNA polymerase-3 subunit epsilon